ncbi:hypothetical protein BSM4216_0856 [Bacillus smithii]|nr:hypothetical protein BSM4216_0856 [Bacillus smithii]
MRLQKRFLPPSIIEKTGLYPTCHRMNVQIREFHFVAEKIQPQHLV